MATLSLSGTLSSTMSSASSRAGIPSSVSATVKAYVTGCVCVWYMRVQKASDVHIKRITIENWTSQSHKQGHYQLVVFQDVFFM